MPASKEIEQLIERIYQAGYFVRLDIGEPDEHDNVLHKAHTKELAMELINAVDDTDVYVYNDQTYLGWIKISLWNDGEEQIIDFTYNKAMCDLIGWEYEED